VDRGWWAIGRAFRVEAEPDEWIDCTDGRLLVLGRYMGHARTTKAPVEAAFAHLWTQRDQRIVRLVQITDSAAWQFALGEGR
jgi:2-(1,2-epoxy-1,2-dihydrophenyl)acetyl-CoA isomerase